MLADPGEAAHTATAIRVQGQGVMIDALMSNGALACLIEDCRVRGLTAQPDDWDLFDGP